MKNLYIPVLCIFAALIVQFAAFIFFKKFAAYFTLFVPVLLGFSASFFVRALTTNGAVSLLLSIIISLVLCLLYWFYIAFLRIDVFELTHPLNRGALFSLFLFTGFLNSSIWALVFGFYFNRHNW